MLKIVNLGHASFLFEGDVSFVIDPYLDNSVPNLKMPRVSVNKVFTSHDHYDHCGVELVTLVPTNKELKYKTVVVPHDHHNGSKRGLNKMHIFFIDGYKIIHTGDLGCIPSEEVLKEMMDTDVLLAPINGYYTISAEELVTIMNLVKPKVTIPMHYYRRDDNSGYPDGGQIDIFKKLVGSFKDVDDSIIVNGELLNNRVVIFNSAMQEK